jgi:multidrug transporter EmrE-like cation transporter
MSPLIVTLVLGAAVLHATWNAMLKSGADRFWMMTALCVVQGTICLLALPFLPLPDAKSWPFIATSAVIHMGYQLLLVRTYKVGDFGQTYPIARGSSPLLIAIGALVFAGESLSAGKIVGILMSRAESSHSPFRASDFISIVRQRRWQQAQL